MVLRDLQEKRADRGFPAALVGTIEELSASRRTQSLIREQFETNFYGPVNCIKAVLPAMRARGNGHVVVLSSISG